MNHREPLIPGASSAFLLATLAYASLAAVVLSLVYGVSRIIG